MVISEQCSDIIATQAPKSGRIDAWQGAATDGGLFAGGAERIPTYSANEWLNAFDRLESKELSNHALELPVYHFFQAAAAHRAYVLRSLLPKHGLVVD